MKKSFKEELMSVKYIGEKTADKITASFSRDEFIEKLKNNYEFDLPPSAVSELTRFYAKQTITEKSEKEKEQNIKNNLSSKDFLEKVREFAKSEKGKRLGYILKVNLPNMIVLSKDSYSNQVLSVRNGSINFFNIREQRVLEKLKEFTLYKKFFNI